MSTPVTQDPRFASAQEALASMVTKWLPGRDEQEQIAATGGAEAVGRAAEPNGTPQQQAAIAAHFERLQHEAGGMTAA